MIYDIHVGTSFSVRTLIVVIYLWTADTFFLLFYFGLMVVHTSHLLLCNSGHGRGGSGRWPRGGQGQRRARRQLGGHGGSTTLSVEALDADLDKYHLEEMETN